ncbi:MAG: hypothetical protein J3Q66DRAFT_412613 [Benniella sp.]|nr:MAG: hypothetical protein J3Q66DRAFT_412613 [Benniella sp.]
MSAFPKPTSLTPTQRSPLCLSLSMLILLSNTWHPTKCLPYHTGPRQHPSYQVVHETHGYQSTIPSKCTGSCSKPIHRYFSTLRDSRSKCVLFLYTMHFALVPVHFLHFPPSSPLLSSPLPLSLSILNYYQLPLPDPHFTHRPHFTDTIMAQGFLKFIRGCLVLLALITIIMTVHTVRVFHIPISEPSAWSVWSPLFLGILSVIGYSWAIKAQTAQKHVLQSNSARYICSILFCAAWLASPTYSVIKILDYLRQYGREHEIFRVWDCGRVSCNAGFAMDICGFLMAFIVLLEVILAYRYERSFNVRKADTPPSTTVVVVGPGHVQQYPAEPAQHFAAYYPQPGMTAPYQSSRF